MAFAAATANATAILALPSGTKAIPSVKASSRTRPIQDHTRERGGFGITRRSGR